MTQPKDGVRSDGCELRKDECPPERRIEDKQRRAPNMATTSKGIAGHYTKVKKASMVILSLSAQPWMGHKVVKNGDQIPEAERAPL